jgi:hypothetical protein
MSKYIYIYQKANNGPVWADLKVPSEPILYKLKPDVNGRSLKSPIPSLQARVTALEKRLQDKGNIEQYAATSAVVPVEKPDVVQTTKPWWKNLLGL